MDKCTRKASHLLVLAMLIMVTSCSTQKVKRDGAPQYHVDVSKVGDAVPKPEPLAKYGNMKSYVVFGKRYYTMKSSNNYEQVGTASWYGTMFHDRSTSSGERYDMLAMTAAHKTLPLPTYVEVTNLSNNRKVIVKVNDRGPFESNRIIDLSYVAAKKLGMLGRGTAQVRVKAINPYTFGKELELAKQTPKTYPKFDPVYTSSHTNKPVYTASSTSYSKPNAKSVYLQVGAFRNKSHADRLQQRLNQLLDAPVKVAKGKLYKVQIGPLNNVTTADKVATRLRGLGIQSNRLYATK